MNFSAKYRDGFWRLAPVPLVTMGALIAISSWRSAVAIPAAISVLLIGVVTEVMIWRRLVVRWEEGVPLKSVGQLESMSMWLRLPFAALILGTVIFVVKAEDHTFASFALAVLTSAVFFGLTILLQVIIDWYKERHP